MASPGRTPSLDKLEAERKALDAKIKAARRAEKRAQAETEKQRFAIIGAAIARELAENKGLLAQLQPVIERRVTKASERRLLGLEPLPRPTTPSAS